MISKMYYYLLILIIFLILHQSNDYLSIVDVHLMRQNEQNKSMNSAIFTAHAPTKAADTPTKTARRVTIAACLQQQLPML